MLCDDEKKFLPLDNLTSKKQLEGGKEQGKAEKNMKK
jgi:hypothetical protein